MYGTMYGATKYGSLGRLSGSMPASVGYMALAGTAYPSVMKLQTRLLPYGVALGSGGADGVYGGKTHRGLKTAMDVIRISVPSIAARADFDRLGPIAVRDLLLSPYFILSSSEVAEIQAAWSTWKDAPPASHRDVADTPAAAEEPPVPPAPPVLDEGMGTGTWILLLLLGAAGAYGVYYLATR